MPMILAPKVEGVVAVRSSAVQFVAAFRRRVAVGLLAGRPHPRSNYRVVEEGAGLLRVRAADYWTAINVGLNEPELRLPSSGSVEFRVQYWRWAFYALGLGVSGLIGLALLRPSTCVATSLATRWAQLPGLSIDQNLGIAWVMVLSWGLRGRGCSSSCTNARCVAWLNGSFVRLMPKQPVTEE